MGVRATPELAPLQPAAEPSAPVPHYVPGPYDGLVVLGLVAFVLLGTVALVLLHRQEKKRYTPLDTRDRLDAYDQRPRGPITILGPTLAYGLPFVFALWHWGALINDTIARWTYQLNNLSAWWATQATPEEQTVLVVLGTAALVILAAFAFVAYYVVFRSLWPDLCRLDPDASPHGRPEALGRLYARATFTDGEKRYVRLYYHQNFRIFPPQCDIVDVPATVPVRHGGIGKLVFFFPRLQRAPKRGRRVRELATRAYGSAPLRSSFRDEEVRRDRRRKVGIVLTGAAQNPDVTQRKYEREATITQFQHDTLRGLLPSEIAAPPTAPPTPPPASPTPPGEVPPRQKEAET